jgi:hypothetical protein
MTNWLFWASVPPLAAALVLVWRGAPLPEEWFPVRGRWLRYLAVTALLATLGAVLVQVLPWEVLTLLTVGVATLVLLALQVAVMALGDHLAECWERAQRDRCREPQA